MRLIDATRLIQLALLERDKIPLTIVQRYSFGTESPNHHGQSMRGGIRKVMRLIEQAPTIDAVPVVRCKECVHSAKLEGYHQRRFENGLNCNACRGENGYGIAKLSLTTPDGYCDYGLRRSSDAND